MNKKLLFLILIALPLFEGVSQSYMRTKIYSKDETRAADVNGSSEVLTTDSPNLGGTDKVFNLTTTAQEFKVGALPKVNRKYILMEATTNRVKWGFNTSCNFALKKNAFFMLPIGENTTVYLCADSGTATMIGGEI